MKLCFMHNQSNSVNNSVWSETYPSDNRQKDIDSEWFGPYEGFMALRESEFLEF